ncbi:hypothetical protein DM794_19050 [Paenarthrobacter ureafaciens]|nr:hypothetical protein [Paenarthrobacter ureafaciens]
MSRDKWPVPYLIRYALLLIGLEDLGRSEKIAFYIPLSYRGRHGAVALQKFGMRLYLDHDPHDEADRAKAEKAHHEIVRKLESAVRIVESWILRPFSEEQVSSGNVTIGNQYGTLRRSYEYFREGARRAFAGDESKSEAVSFGGLSLVSDPPEGFYNLVAALNAYLSLLEHTLVLALPFTDFSPETESLPDFISQRWGDKYGRVFDSQDRDARRHRDQLVRLVETWRNTYSHGGFDKHQATIHFHVPGVGAVPAAFSDIRDSPHFQFVPAREADFEEAMKTLDALDSWLQTGPLSDAMLWILEGLDVRYDKDFREELRLARDAGQLEDMIQHHSYLWEQNANMDW